jgi:hypothetical protein
MSTDVSEVRAASVIKAMMDAAHTSETMTGPASTSETSDNFNQIHGETSQKTAIF